MTFLFFEFHLYFISSDELKLIYSYIYMIDLLRIGDLFVFQIDSVNSCYNHIIVFISLLMVYFYRINVFYRSFRPFTSAEYLFFDHYLNVYTK